MLKFTLLAFATCILFLSCSKDSNSHNPVNPQPALSPDALLQARVDRLSSDVEAIRRFSFTAPVKAQFISRDQIVPLLDSIWFASEHVPMDTSLKQEGVSYYAVGFTDSIQAYVDDFKTAFTQFPAGFYETSTRRIFILDTFPTAAEDTLEYNSLLAHELDHALQDQVFGLDSFSNGLTIDETDARNYIVEGDAMVVYLTYLNKKYNKESLANDWIYGFATPWTLASMFEAVSTPEYAYLEVPLNHVYYQGAYIMRETFINRNGWEGINGLYLYPPVSTRQCLHVADLFADVRPVGFNQGDLFSSFLAYPYFEDNSLGELELSVLLSCRADLSHQYTAQGWKGDHYWIYKDSLSDKFSLLWNTAWETPEAALSFFNHYKIVLRNKYKALAPSDSAQDSLYTLSSSDSLRTATVIKEGADVWMVEGVSRTVMPTVLAALKTVRQQAVLGRSDAGSDSNRHTRRNVWPSDKRIRYYQR